MKQEAYEIIVRTIVIPDAEHRPMFASGAVKNAIVATVIQNLAYFYENIQVETNRIELDIGDEEE
jgi:hypothetical protein